ncbi:MAG TPA: hypothetical protein VEL51_19265 [Vicinamibacterales bacterium]|nr:hypothetical protein [Vicinamibacterales bacterium]
MSSVGALDHHAADDVAHCADHRNFAVAGEFVEAWARRSLDADPLPDRIGARPERPRGGLADNGDARGRPRFVGAKCATSRDRDLKHREVLRRHEGVAGRSSGLQTRGRRSDIKGDEQWIPARNRNL